MSVIDPASASGGPVRVAMILANPCTNDARVIKEAEALVRRGYEVRVFCLAAPGLPDIEQSNGVVYQRIRPPHRAVVPGVSGRLPVIAQAPQSRAGRIAVLAPRRWAASLKRLVGPFLENELLAWAFVGPVARFRPRIVHAHDFNTLTAALRAARKTGAAVVYDMHEMEEARLPMAGPLLARFKQAIERRAIRRVDRAITVSPSIVEHYARKYGIEPPALVLNAPAVVLGRATPDDVRRRAGLGPQTPLAVYVGVVGEGRGIEHMLAAVAAAPGIHLALLGPVREAMRPALERAMRDEASKGRIHPLGLVPHGDVVPFIRTADLGLCTILGTCLNYEYCLPNKLFEMTFAGLPVVVSENVELKRFVEMSGTGIAVPADDPAAIAAAMQRILAGRDGFRPDAERLARLYGRFGWERQEERLAAVYDGVLERAGRPTQSVGSAARGAAGLVGSKA
ncbi:MAG: glycosyltransferase [Hyphomicrobiaceae bacterium]